VVAPPVKLKCLQPRAKNRSLGSRVRMWLLNTRVGRRLPKMDARRAEINATLDDQRAVSALTKEGLAALHKEKEACTEAGLLRELLHEAVHSRNAKDNCTVLLIRFNWGEH